MSYKFPDLTPIFTRPDTFALNFVEFLKEYNIVGLGIGALVASNTMDIGKAIVDSLVMPIVTGIVTRTAPTFTYYSLVQSLITFLVTMFFIFFLMSIFGIRATKPVSYVRIVKPDIEGSLGKFEGYMNCNGNGNGNMAAEGNGYGDNMNKNM